MEVLEKVCTKCLSSYYMDQLVSFMNEHETTYVGRTSVDGEHSNENFVLYKQFSSLIEDIVTNACAEENISAESFYKLCSEEHSTPTFDVLSQVLLISTEFQTFDDVMRDKEKRRYMFNIWRTWGNTLSKATMRK